MSLDDNAVKNLSLSSKVKLLSLPTESFPVPSTVPHRTSNLDLASASYLESDDGINMEPAKGVVNLSTLLKWYRTDFGETDREVHRFGPSLVRARPASTVP